uniref:Uncharacterized protein n=1 Tax=Opuntia streptacantha TaxID=393608 RepID=A0A7C9CSV4_OPUST
MSANPVEWTREDQEAASSFFLLFSNSFFSCREKSSLASSSSHSSSVSFSLSFLMKSALMLNSGNSSSFSSNSSIKSSTDSRCSLSISLGCHPETEPGLQMRLNDYKNLYVKGGLHHQRRTQNFQFSKPTVVTHLWSFNQSENPSPLNY